MKNLPIILFIITCFSFSIFSAFAEKTHELSEIQATISRTSLNIQLDRYYQLKKSNKPQAKKLLGKIIKEFPNNAEINKEMGYLLLEEKKPKAALAYFLQAKKINPYDKANQLQIAHIYAQLNRNAKARTLFRRLAVSKNPAIRKEALNELTSLSRPAKNKKSPVNQRTEALKDKGYKLLNQGQPQKALPFFLRAQELEPNSYITAAELGYLYASIGENEKAYEQFKFASHSSDPKLMQESQEMLADTFPSKYKILPDPWFADIYFEPTYISRFNDVIFPLTTRIGRSFGKNNQLELYAKLKATYSAQVNPELAEIYEEDAVILTVGIDYQPFIKIPLHFYGEYGGSYDLRNLNRDRWREDIRGGVYFYKMFMPDIIYSSKLRFMLKPYADTYGEISYYSRYDDDIIGDIKIRPGLRVFQWRNSHIDIYARGRLVQDSKRTYYNNFVEYGPGIALTPYDPIDLVFRAEPTWGNYFGADNPLNKKMNYYQTVILAEFYIRF